MRTYGEWRLKWAQNRRSPPARKVDEKLPTLHGLKTRGATFDQLCGHTACFICHFLFELWTCFNFYEFSSLNRDCVGWNTPALQLPTDRPSETQKVLEQQPIEEVTARDLLRDCKVHYQSFVWTKIPTYLHNASIYVFWRAIGHTTFRKTLTRWNLVPIMKIQRKVRSPHQPPTKTHLLDFIYMYSFSRKKVVFWCGETGRRRNGESLLRLSCDPCNVLVNLL